MRIPDEYGYQSGEPDLVEVSVKVHEDGEEGDSGKGESLEAETPGNSKGHMCRDKGWGKEEKQKTSRKARTKTERTRRKEKRRKKKGNWKKNWKKKGNWKKK